MSCDTLHTGDRITTLNHSFAVMRKPHLSLNILNVVAVIVTFFVYAFHWKYLYMSTSSESSVNQSYTADHKRSSLILEISCAKLKEAFAHQRFNQFRHFYQEDTYFRVISSGSHNKVSVKLVGCMASSIPLVLFVFDLITFGYNNHWLMIFPLIYRFWPCLRFCAMAIYLIKL